MGDREPQAANGEQEGERLPWYTPVLKVDLVGEITRSGSTSSKNDGSSVYAPTS